MFAKKGQSTIEYFIMFAVICGLIIFAINSFKNTSEKFFDKSASKILNTEVNTATQK